MQVVRCKYNQNKDLAIKGLTVVTNSRKNFQKKLYLRKIYTHQKQDINSIHKIQTSMFSHVASKITRIHCYKTAQIAIC